MGGAAADYLPNYPSLRHEPDKHARLAEKSCRGTHQTLPCADACETLTFTRYDSLRLLRELGSTYFTHNTCKTLLFLRANFNQLAIPLIFHKMFFISKSFFDRLKLRYVRNVCFLSRNERETGWLAFAGWLVLWLQATHH